MEQKKRKSNSLASKKANSKSSTNTLKEKNKKNKSTVSKNKNLKIKKKDKKIKKEGFTLIELIATIAVLALVIGIATASYIGIKNNTLEKDYDNLVAYIESKASLYAQKTGITTVSVEDLIKAGELSPEDETDLYNPINRASLNCYIVKSEYKDGEYISKLVEKDNRDASGKCRGYELTKDYTLCEYKSNGTCQNLDGKWKNDNFNLAIREGQNGNVINNKNYTYAWVGTSGQTSTEAIIQTNIALAAKSIYRVQVTMDQQIAEASGEVLIDKENPAITNTQVPDGYQREKQIQIEATDFNGSGLKGISIGNVATCSNNQNDYKNEYTKKVDQDGKFYICAMDNVGNKTATGTEVIVDKIDKEAVLDNDIDLKASTTEYTQKLTITGTATDYKSGLVEYQFTSSNEVPGTWKKISNGPTNKKITYDMEITENGTYYFWVKDLVGNISNKKIDINNIDRNIDLVELINEKEGEWVTTLNLIGHAKDNKAGIVAYQFNQSSVQPTKNWKTVDKTNELTEKLEITKNGTYYFWVKDKADNIDKFKLKIENIGQKLTKVISGSSEESSTITGSVTISGIKKVLEDETVIDNGKVTFNIKNNTLEYTFKDGTEKKGVRNGSYDRTPSTYEGRYFSFTMYVCANGVGTTNPDGCKERVEENGDSYNVSCTCNPTTKTYNTCMSYGAESYCDRDNSSPVGRGAFDTYPGAPYDGKACTSDLTYTTHGIIICEYNNIKDSYPYSDYSCDYGGQNIGSTCYECNSDESYVQKGSAYVCHGEAEDVPYSYWEYTATITYIV